jgi:hypothetical protein
MNNLIETDGIGTGLKNVKPYDGKPKPTEPFFQNLKIQSEDACKSRASEATQQQTGTHTEAPQQKKGEA